MLSPARLLGAIVGLAVLFVVIAQFSIQYAILIVLFLALVIPFMKAVMSGEH
ncbi:MAG: hypothetical protein R3190_06025 [Thermoanaerobaculia bacterium]|nr:hypothetical protein [Thermoanaerobaculia bacterium]